MFVRNLLAGAVAIAFVIKLLVKIRPISVGGVLFACPRIHVSVNFVLRRMRRGGLLTVRMGVARVRRRKDSSSLNKTHLAFFLFHFPCP